MNHALPMEGEASQHAPASIMTSRVLNKDEAARYCGFSTRTLDRLAADGRGPVCIQLTCRKLGFRQADLDAWLAARTRPAKHKSVV